MSTTREKILYALPAYILAYPIIPTFVYLPTFYGETLGLGLSIVGIILLFLRVFDVITDPIIGWISDRIPKRYGKRKLPMVVGGLIGGPSLVALFSPPNNVGPLYLFIWGLLLYLSWTAIQIPYYSWAAELEPEYKERVKLNSYREGAGLIGVLSFLIIIFFLNDISIAESLKTISCIVLLIGSVVFFIPLKFVPQGRVTDKKEKITLPYENKVFLRLTAAWFFNGLANGLPAVCLPLYLSYIIQVDENTKSLFILLYFLFAVLAIPLWVYLSKYMDKHKVWCLSMIFASIVFLFVPLLWTQDIIAFGIICILTGIALGSDLILPPSIQADCADWDRLRYKKERTGILFSYWSMSTKLALGLAVGISFPILEFLGLSENNLNAKIALIMIYAGIPVVLKMCAVLLMWNFPLTHKKHLGIKHALEKIK